MKALVNMKCFLPILAASILATNSIAVNAATINTANPNATQKAKAILNYLYNLEGQSLSGHYIGINEKPFIEQFNSVGTITGEYPSIMGSDYPGDTARNAPRVVPLAGQNPRRHILQPDCR